MSDIDELSARYEDLANDVSLLKQAYGGLSFPKTAHEAIRRIGFQSRYKLQVPLAGSDCFIFETVTQVNGSFDLSINDMCGTRLWAGTWQDAA